MDDNFAEIDTFFFITDLVIKNTTGIYILRLLLYVLIAAEPVHMSIQESGSVPHKVCAYVYACK